jgi:hypothetical protein
MVLFVHPIRSVPEAGDAAGTKKRIRFAEQQNNVNGPNGYICRTCP